MSSANKSNFSNQRTATVLVVDDNDDLRKLLCLTLEQEGIEVASAPSGRDALLQYHKAVAEGRPFTVLLLDDALPDVPGTLVGESIRLLEQFPSAYPTALHIYYSAHQGPMSNALKERCRPDGYITKPGERAELLAAIRQTMSDCR